jgi:hypothetical protein
LELVRQARLGIFRVQTVSQSQPKPRKQQKLLFEFWIRLGIGLLGTFFRLSKAVTDLISMIVHLH